MLTEIFQRPLFLVLLWRLAVHEVVETNAVLEKVVHTTQHAEDTEGEDPNADNCDNGGLATNEPTEETEKGGNQIDDKDSTAELPRWDGRPEGTVGTGDEDEPYLRISLENQSDVLSGHLQFSDREIWRNKTSSRTPKF